MPVVFGQECFDTLTATAQSSPRRRKNLDLHDAASHPAQRLLNAVEPDSYIRPHRHLAPRKDETFVVVKGTFGLVLFDESGRVSESHMLSPDGKLVGAHVPGGVFHCLVALEPGSVFFEAKAGPYDAATDKDWPSWAPAESSPDAPAYLARLKALFENQAS
jgi:cupin fold WbuC family metalloprotein